MNPDKKLKKELKSYRKSGIPLVLEGEESTPEEIVQAHCISEDSIYMRDYVQNEEGEFVELRFDKVKKM